jgi:transposase
MASKTRKRRGAGRRNALPKPRGVIHPRVQKVGPEHFGIVAVDCAKARSKWLLADFYGSVLIPPTAVEHARQSLDGAVALLRQTIQQRDIRDVLVVVERTGRYHHPVKRAFAQAGFDTRVIHPFTTKHMRLPADPGIKTDDTDLSAIWRGAINGFALAEAPLQEFWEEFRLLVRHRRDWVCKTSALCCQIKEHLHAALPGFAACFPKLWENPACLHLALHFESIASLRQADPSAMAAALRAAEIGFQRRTLHRIAEWAAQAPEADVAGQEHRRIAAALNQDRMQKEQQIQGLELRIASYLVRTPYVLLMVMPGINVVSAAELAAEAGPMEHYANGRCLTGRAGLYPSRHQSDQVDHPDGPIVRCANRRLRFALLQIADNLISCNRHFRTLAAGWKQNRADPRLIRIRVAQRAARIAFHVVGGRQAFDHPCVRDRHYVLRKLVAFYQEHGAVGEQVRTDLHAALDQIPAKARPAEIPPLQEQLRAHQRARRPTALAEILPDLLARLRPPGVQSDLSGAQDPA